MKKLQRCENCGKQRKKSHEKNLQKTECPKHKHASEASSTYPAKTFTGGGLINPKKSHSPIPEKEKLGKIRTVRRSKNKIATVSLKRNKS